VETLNHFVIISQQQTKTKTKKSKIGIREKKRKMFGEREVM